VYSALYDAPSIPRLPRAIDAARNSLLDPLWPKVARDQRRLLSLVSQAAHDAWICNEQAPFTTQARVAAVDRRYPELADIFSQIGMLGLCHSAGLGRRAPAIENQPVRSGVPTLLLTGRFDPVSPVEQARAAAHTLSRAHVVVFTTLGHGVFDQSPCARRIALDFLDRPARQPETGCLGRMPPITWRAHS
jgi:pimeloyl-ACP methyl ester carboxylesterase